MTTRIDDVDRYITGTLDGVNPVSAWGETAYFYNPGLVLKRGTYFATIKQKDGDNDRASGLDRDGVWRLNIGLGKKAFLAMFKHQPARPAKGGVIEGPWDFTEIDRITPHPVYGWMGWIAVLNPGEETFETCKPLIATAHQRAADGFGKRIRQS
ncbi:MAG: DUF6194 family protein [Hoeflea sp.]|nr:DUF6194 family protein [Hoeflea sp.]